MLTLKSSLIFSILMGLRSSVPVVLGFFLVESHEPGAADLMLMLQTSAIYGSMIYLICYNTLSIEYALFRVAWLDKFIRYLVVLHCVAGVYFLLVNQNLYIALTINTIVASLVFVRPRVLLLWKVLLVQSLAVVLFVFYSILASNNVDRAIEGWLLFYFMTVLMNVIGPYSKDDDGRGVGEKVKSIIGRIPKISTVSICFMLVALIERYAIDDLIPDLDGKKNFLFFVSIVNLVAIVGSGFLSILGPKIAKGNLSFKEAIKVYRGQLFLFGALQLLLGLMVILILMGLIGVEEGWVAYAFKIGLLVSMFYYQLMNQFFQFSERHLRAISNSVVLLVMVGAAWFFGSYSGDVMFFYMLAFFSPILISLVNFLCGELVHEKS